MKLNSFKVMPLVLAIGLAIAGCGGGGGNNDSVPDPDPDPTPTPTSATLTGTVVANGDDVNQVASISEKFFHRVASTKIVQRAIAQSEVSNTGASTNSALMNADVELVKIFADGTSEAVDTGTVQTDLNGQFTITDVDIPAVSDDFYYELQVTKTDGTDTIVVRAPLSPEGDTDLAVTPETTMAAEVLTDVARDKIEVPGATSLPLPSSDAINAMRELAINDLAQLQEAGSVQIPGGLAGNDEAVNSAANGVTTTGGETQMMSKTLAFESEYNAIAARGENMPEENAAGYLRRVVKESCNQGTVADFLPQAAADALAQFFVDGGTVTAQQIVDAYNANRGSEPQVDVDAAVALFASLMGSVEANLGARADSATGIDAVEQLALYTKRDLDADTFTATTAMAADQAAAFVMLLGANQSELDQVDGDGNPMFRCGQHLQNINLLAMIGTLVGDSGLATARITEFQAYNVSAGGCSGSQVPLAAEVRIYAAGKTVTGVALTSDDAESFPDGPLALTQEGANYRVNPFSVSGDSHCVDSASEQIITATVTFSDASTATKTVTRYFPLVTEPQSEFFVGGAFVTANSVDTVVVDTARPLYQWTDPETLFTQTSDAGANAAVKDAMLAAHADGKLKIKYQYEMAHLVPPYGGPDNRCATIAAGPLYETNSFMPTEDCDIAACATATGEAAADVKCRFNIQSYVVDENDNILGQAAGNFRFFCVDTNGDNDCGE